MARHLSRSTWLKLMALGIAVLAFILVYEARIFDSFSTGPTSTPSEFPAPGRTLRFSATSYCKGTTTAAGVRVRSGIVAADPALLPIGSVIRISDAGRYDGVYSVLDTGPKVKGRLLDLYIWSCFEALRFGRRDVEVTVLRLGWDPDASSPETSSTLVRERDAARRAAPAPPAPEVPTGDPAPEAPIGDPAPETPAGDLAPDTEGDAAENP